MDLLRAVSSDPAGVDSATTTSGSPVLSVWKRALTAHHLTARCSRTRPSRSAASRPLAHFARPQGDCREGDTTPSGAPQKLAFFRRCTAAASIPWRRSAEVAAPKRHVRQLEVAAPPRRTCPSAAPTVSPSPPRIPDGFLSTASKKQPQAFPATRSPNHDQRGRISSSAPAPCQLRSEAFSSLMNDPQANAAMYQSFPPTHPSDRGNPATPENSKADRRKHRDRSAAR